MKNTASYKIHYTLMLMITKNKPFFNIKNSQNEENSNIALWIKMCICMLPKITLYTTGDTCPPGPMRKFTEQNMIQPLKSGFLFIFLIWVFSM